MTQYILSFNSSTGRVKKTAIDSSTVALTSAALAQGSLLFADSSGNVAQDNANLLWDAVHHRLGVGTGSPLATLDGGGAPVSLGAAVNVTGLFTRSDTGNSILEQYHSSLILTGSTSNGTLAELTFATASFKGVQVNYTITDAANDVRVGTLMVANSAANATLSLTDSYTETATTDVVWTAAYSGGNFVLQYTTTVAGNRTMQADVKSFRS